jgi:hypothetical protein
MTDFSAKSIAAVRRDAQRYSQVSNAQRLKTMKTCFLLFLLPFLLLAGCKNSTPASPLPRFDDDTEAIQWLLQAESRGVVNRDTDLLTAIWAEDGQVIDAHHTPDDTSDDARWQGIDAVMNRYVTLVFPGNPILAAPADVQIQVQGHRATARTTTRINNELSPGGDAWEFVKQDGVWRIRSLTYNLEFQG